MYLAWLQVEDDPDAARETGERAVRDFEREGDRVAADRARADLAMLLRPPSRWARLLAILAVLAAAVAAALYWQR